MLTVENNKSMRRGQTALPGDMNIVCSEKKNQAKESNFIIPMILYTYMIIYYI